jgi:hypothetical protein
MFISLRKKWCLQSCKGHCASSLKTRVAGCVNNVMCDMMIEVEVGMRCPLFGPIVLRPMVVWIPLQLQIRFPLTRQVLHITSSAETSTQTWLACATHGMSCMSLAGFAHYGLFQSHQVRTSVAMTGTLTVWDITDFRYPFQHDLAS